MSRIAAIDFGDCGLHVKESDICKDTLKTMGLKVKNALYNDGFCYLKNHGVDENLINDYMECSRGLFESPVELKQGYKTGKEIRFGWIGLDEEIVNPERPTDLKESFLYSPCKEMAFWPAVDNFEQMTKELHRICTALSYRFLDVLSYGLGLPVEILRSAHKFIGQKGNTSAIASQYYPPIPSIAEIKPGQIRIGEHTDFGTFTFIFQDGTGGLDIQHPNGYIEATPVQGTAIVVIGDLLQRLLSDSLVASKHRVLIPKDDKRKKKCRQSIVFFANSDDDYVIECLDGENKYEPIKTIDYIIYKGKRIFVE